MSLTRRTSRSVFSRAIATISRASSGSSPATPASSSPSEPRIEVSGVRSSWPTTDSSSSLIRSISLRSVMSSIIPIADVRPAVGVAQQRRGHAAPEHRPVGAHVALLAPVALAPPRRTARRRSRSPSRSAGMRDRRGSGSPRSSSAGMPTIAAERGVDLDEAARCGRPASSRSRRRGRPRGSAARSRARPPAPARARLWLSSSSAIRARSRSSAISAAPNSRGRVSITHSVPTRKPSTVVIGCPA